MSHTDERKQIGWAVSMDGEIINKIYAGDRLVSSTKDEYAEKYIINFNKKEAFVKVFQNPLLQLHRELTTRENSVLMGLMPFISYKDGVLRCDNQVLDIKTMSEILGEEYGGFRKAIISLIEKEVLKKIDIKSETNSSKTKKCFVVNPFIFFRGTDVDRSITSEFINSKWAEYYRP